MFFLFVFFYHSWTDTAAKLATTKAVAADANATAIDVLERLGDLNLQLNGLQRNYSELEDTVNTANQMIQDPEKNSKALYFWLYYHCIVYLYKSEHDNVLFWPIEY